MEIIERGILELVINSGWWEILLDNLLQNFCEPSTYFRGKRYTLLIGHHLIFNWRQLITVAHLVVFGNQTLENGWENLNFYQQSRSNVFLHNMKIISSHIFDSMSIIQIKKAAIDTLYLQQYLCDYLLELGTWNSSL